MLQNSSVTAITVFELLRENQLGGSKINPPARLGLSADVGEKISIEKNQNKLVKISRK